MASEMRSPSSSKPTTILRHLSHRNHPIHLLFIPTKFFYSGCDALGFGARYRCEICDFNLHDICATCPSATTTTLRSNHSLALTNDPLSHLCGDCVRGLFYTCSACDFNVHPLCTRLPLNVQLLLHPQHLLKRQPTAVRCASKVVRRGGYGYGYGAYEMAAPAAVGKLGRQTSGKSRKKTYLYVARVAASVVSAVTGVPLDLFNLI